MVTARPTRRALLGAGAAALLAGCGPSEEPEVVAADVLSDRLRVAQAAAAAYAGVAGAEDLHSRANARAGRLAAAVRRAGGTAAPFPGGPSGLEPALAAERRALQSYVAAVGLLEAREWRALFAGLVAGSAASEAELLARLDRPPAPTAFPGQP